MGVKPGFTALIVDDDAASRHIAAARLYKLGALSVKEASDGDAALRLVGSCGMLFDLIICDLKMPEVDGIETLRLLAVSQFDALVVLASNADHRIIRTAAEMISGFGISRIRTIAKPITLKKLRHAIYEHVDYCNPTVPFEDSTKKLAFTRDEIRRGILDNEFIPYFQPKVELRTRRIKGAEALVRWQHPLHGMLSPASFLHAAHMFDLLHDISCCMLASAAAYCVLWRRGGIDLNVSINLPISALTSRDTPRRLQRIVERQGLTPEYVIFEVTEDGLLKNQPVARENLTRLRLLGFGLSIDDFGTGYASLQQLLQAPFNEMKIDQSFVRAALDDKESSVALTSSIMLARNLGLSVVGEGVASFAQWALLERAGCDLAQGYYVAKPMPGAAFATWAESWDRPTDADSYAAAAHPSMMDSYSGAQ